MHVINITELDNSKWMSLRGEEKNENGRGEKLLAFGLLPSLSLCLFTLSLRDLLFLDCQGSLTTFSSFIAFEPPSSQYSFPLTWVNISRLDSFLICGS